MSYRCVECGEPMDEGDETDYTDEGYRHWDCGEWLPETEEDEKAVDAFVFMIGLEDLAEAYDEVGETGLASRTREALDAVAERYVDLYTETNDE